ncbi:MAG: transglutaminase family protein [Chloroflexi bacterium]|nr:transglutaminase family protein [Chloroflexota bacterium]
MDPRDAFAELLERDDAEIDLDRAALLVAAVEYPGLDVDAYLRRLDAMADEIRPRIDSDADPRLRVTVLAAFLSDDYGLRGNADAYYDPRNSYLNEVLDRRLGIPISLSAIYLEVGRRLDLPLEGVGMPGHFLIHYRHPTNPLLLDPFAAGRIVTEDDCTERLRSLHGADARLTPEMLQPVGTRAILFRMLNNLKGIYGALAEYRRAVRTVDLMLAVQPSALGEYRDRGMLLFRAGHFKPARASFEHYLTEAPDASDAASVREQLALIERLEAMRN